MYNSSIEYAKSFDLDSVSLYFYGRTGLGKTHLSLAIANEAVKKGYNVVYGSVINFLNKMEKETIFYSSLSICLTSSPINSTGENVPIILDAILSG